MALGRTTKARAKLMRGDPATRKGVTDQMCEFVDKGIARKVDPAVPLSADTPVWVNPLHVVTRAAKPGKWRVCHDARASVNRVCLNEELVSGPDVVNSLLGVLLRFRRHMVTISGDIAGFFHQVFTTEENSHVF